MRTKKTNSTLQQFATTSKGILDKENITASSRGCLIVAQNSVAAEDELTVILKAKGTFITFKLNTGANASMVPQKVITAPRESGVQNTADSCWEENSPCPQAGD